MNGKLKIPYGISDFKRIRTEGMYYVDKTQYVRLLEERDSFVFFVRPRRFGKSLFASMLACYYDVNEKQNFEKLFGGLAIGREPTEFANRYLVLKLDFSTIGAGNAVELAERFDAYMDERLDDLLRRYADFFGTDFVLDAKKRPPATKFTAVSSFANSQGAGLYLIVDEYDNFTNVMMSSETNRDYRGVTHGDGFYRSWFKIFKSTCSRIFLTGVSPVTMDDLTSGFNIASNVTTDADFNAMLGFTEAETLKLYEDFKGQGKYLEGDPAGIVREIKPWYDGYCFAERKIGEECVFNGDMVLRHLKSLVASGHPPDNWVDGNAKTDYAKLRMIADVQRRQKLAGAEGVLPLTEQIAAEGGAAFDLVDSFPADEIQKPANFRSLFHYYGILSMAGRHKGSTWFEVPNACVGKQVFAWLRDAYERAREPDWIELSRLASAFAYDGEWKPYLERLAADYADTSPSRSGISGEIRIQGYMQAEFGHLNYYLAVPEMELSRGHCDFCLFPERVRYGDAGHSYLIELKYAKEDATDAQMAAKREEAAAQLARYRADKSVPSLARGTTLHQIVYLFKGTVCAGIEQIAEETMP